MKLKNVSHYSRFLLDGQLFRCFFKETLRTALINCERWVAFIRCYFKHIPWSRIVQSKVQIFYMIKIILFIYINKTGWLEIPQRLYILQAIFHGNYWTMQTLNLNLACYSSLYIKILLLWLAKWECCKYLGTKWKSTTVITRRDRSFNRNNVIMKAILC